MKTHHQTKVLEVYLTPYFTPRTILLTVCNINFQNVIILIFSSAEKKYHPPKQNIRHANYIANGVMTVLIPEYLVLIGDVSI